VANDADAADDDDGDDAVQMGDVSSAEPLAWRAGVQEVGLIASLISISAPTRQCRRQPYSRRRHFNY